MIKQTRGCDILKISCSLCLYEKLLICEFQDISRLIDKRSEFLCIASYDI